jgi:hypothetical protein
LKFQYKKKIHVVKDHNIDQKGRDNKSDKNLFWNISTYGHVSFHETRFVSNLILFKETLSLVGTSLGSFIFFYVGKERVLLVVSEYDQQMLFPLLVCA